MISNMPSNPNDSVVLGNTRIYHAYKELIVPVCVFGLFAYVAEFCTCVCVLQSCPSALLCFGVSFQCLDLCTSMPVTAHQRIAASSSQPFSEHPRQGSRMLCCILTLPFANAVTLHAHLSTHNRNIFADILQKKKEVIIIFGLIDCSAAALLAATLQMAVSVLRQDPNTL